MAVPFYNPDAGYEIESRDIVLRSDLDFTLRARIHQPQGSGPFPILLDIHGGAWGSGDPHQNVKAQTAFARSGIVDIVLDFRTSAVAPHPAAMEDISYAIRWLKAHAAEFNASPEAMGATGWSSGGHQVMLAAMRPRLYATLPLAEAPEVDASLAYLVLGWPVIDPLARHRLAQEGNLVSLTRDVNDFEERHYAYFGDEAGMIEANPQLILERGEQVELPPTLIVQGSADAQLPRMMAERFVEAYSQAGGLIELGKYPGGAHGFIRNSGPNADRAMGQIKAYIARRLTELRTAE